MKRLIKGVLQAHYCLGIFAWLLLCSIPGGSVLGDASKDYKLKAAYLVRFAHYIGWPQLDTDTITIGVFGKHGFDNMLARVNSMQAQGKSLRMKEVSSINDAMTCCQILFISRSERGRIQEILDGLKDQDTPVVTVSELGNFISQGGMIEFVRKGSKLKYKVHLSRIKEAGLTTNPKLAKSGMVVK